MTHDQNMMLLAIKFAIEDGDVEKAGRLARTLVSGLTRFYDPAYLKQERNVSRVQRSIRRNVK